MKGRRKRHTRRPRPPPPPPAVAIVRTEKNIRDRIRARRLAQDYRSPFLPYYLPVAPHGP